MTPEAGARISAALVKALAEPKTLADGSDVGPEFRDIIQHAREMYDLLLEQVIAAEPAAAVRAQATQFSRTVSTRQGASGRWIYFLSDPPPVASAFTSFGASLSPSCCLHPRTRTIAAIGVAERQHDRLVERHLAALPPSPLECAFIAGRRAGHGCVPIIAWPLVG